MTKLASPLARQLAPGQTARVNVIDVDTGRSRIVHENNEVLLEAPNWEPDGSLMLNGDGVLWRLDVETSELRQIRIDELPEVNNDHVIAPDGDRIYISANDGHIYEAPSAGGSAHKLTPSEPCGRKHYLHGVSPTGDLLAYIGVDDDGAGQRHANVFVHRLTDDRVTQLTVSALPADGCEFTPDGEWLVFNTEQFSAHPGHAQLARMRVDGNDLHQLTFDERVNWFPHVSPDGRRVVYLSYEAGTLGHPADRLVQLRLADDGDFSSPRVLATLLGGQGTINVNSWAPDSQRLAFVDYPSKARRDL